MRVITCRSDGLISGLGDNREKNDGYQELHRQLCRAQSNNTSKINATNMNCDLNVSSDIRDLLSAEIPQSSGFRCTNSGMFRGS